MSAHDMLKTLIIITDLCVEIAHYNYNVGLPYFVQGCLQQAIKGFLSSEVPSLVGA